jgi:uncharacterized protein (DUF2141 family)
MLISAITGHTELSSGNIFIKMNGFRNTKGKIGILFFTNKKGFPEKAQKAYKAYSSTFTTTSPTIIFGDIPYGAYAVTVMHDANSNNKLDKNWIGMPVEGIGFSNNAKGSMGPPKYKDAEFELNKSSITLNIQIKYLKKD